MRNKEPDQQYSEQETIRRRDEAVRRALNTPPKPYKDAKVGKAKSPATGKAPKSTR